MSFVKADRIDAAQYHVSGQGYTASLSAILASFHETSYSEMGGLIGLLSSQERQSCARIMLQQ